MTNKPKTCDCDLVDCGCPEDNSHTYSKEDFEIESKTTSSVDPQTIGEILKEFDKEFGHYGEIWNGKKGSKDELEIKNFITHALQSYEEATRVERTPNIDKIDNEIANQLNENMVFGFNYAVSQQAQKRKAFWGE